MDIWPLRPEPAKAATAEAAGHAAARKPAAAAAEKLRKDVLELLRLVPVVLALLPLQHSTATICVSFNLRFRLAMLCPSTTFSVQCIKKGQLGTHNQYNCDHDANI